MKRIKQVAYRLRQVRQQLGFADPLSEVEKQTVAELLPEAAYTLFTSQSDADQQHALRVCRGLQARGHSNPDLLVAALLHDVGKGNKRVPFWTRPAIVLGKRLTPGLLKRLVHYPVTKNLPRWQRSLSYAWWHADVGADLAADISLNAEVVAYIRRHHRPNSPELAELHLVDEAS